jgi:UDP-N-acetylmuramoyl-tripeptide--D-alanyl-D-alanine ligase
LVTHRPDGVSADAPLLIVDDVLEGLAALGRAARARTKAHVAAITGSVGKTSTKEMLRAVLQKQGKCHAAEASYNNHWGVPLTLARMPADTDFAVIEIGMSNPGEITPLSRMARPHVAMVTTVAAAHLASFDSLAGIAHEKACIMDGLEAGGVAVLNADIATTQILQDHAAKLGARQVLFGATAPDWTVEDVRITGDVTVIKATGAGNTYLFKLYVPGRHFAMNAVGVLAVAEALGADPVAASLDIAAWVPPAGRGTREIIVTDMANDGESLELLDDAFNANPTSLIASLEVLAASTPSDGVGRIVKGRRVAILGDMLELGKDEIMMHKEFATNPHLQSLDLIHCAGPLMRHLWDALPEAKQGQWAATAAELVPQVTRLVDAGDVVLVKGSKGSKVSLVVDAIRKLGHRRSDDQ